MSTIKKERAHTKETQYAVPVVQDGSVRYVYLLAARRVRLMTGADTYLEIAVSSTDEHRVSIRSNDGPLMVVPISRNHVEIESEDERR